MSAPDRHAGERVFISYSHDMAGEAESLREKMQLRGWLVEPQLQPAQELPPKLDSAIALTDDFVVLVPLAGATSHRQRGEIGEILERAWSNSDVRVAVVAPAVAAIPSALRNRPFVTYYPHDQVKVGRWPFDASLADQFIDLLSDASPAEATSRQSDEEKTIREWRNRLVHLGRGSDDRIPEDYRQSFVERLGRDLDLAAQALADGTGWASEQMLDRVLLSEMLGAHTLAQGFYRLMSSDANEKEFEGTGEFADGEYSRALAAFEVGAYDEARTRFERAATAGEIARGGDDPRTVAATYNGALAAEKLGDDEGAEELYRRALDSAQRGLGAFHPQTASIAFNLAAIKARQGDNDEALRLFRIAEAAYRHVTPSDSPELASVTEELQRLSP